MLSYLDTASIDLLRIARIAILAVALASMVGAVLGVALQRATLSPTMQRCGWILLVLCLAIQPLSLAVTFSIDSEIGLRQHMTVLKSRERVANRTLSRSEKDRLSASLALFAGQTVETVEFPVSFESDWIANQIQALLDKALWIASPVSRLSAAPQGALVQGFRVSATADDQSQAAAGFLVGVLNGTVSIGSFDPLPLPDPDRPRVRIYIGDRPAPLSSWVGSARDLRSEADAAALVASPAEW